MAKAFCIPAEIASKLKEEARNGKFKVADLYDMTTEQRQSAFSEVVDRATAKEINTAFEKAISKQTLKGQQEALKKWAEATFEGKKNEQKLSDVMTKISKLSEKGYLTPASEKDFYADLVAEKLGVTVTTEEAKKIVNLSKRMEETFTKFEKLGVPGVKEKEQLDYLFARREMDNYLDSLTPSSRLRLITSTISRGNMLFRLPSILVNINSNNIEGAISAVVRRFSERGIKGYNSKEVGSYARFITKVYKKTGYDLSRMESLQGGRKVLGEEIATSQGKGVIRRIARWYEDKVFGLTQGLPDVVASSLAFGDRANLMSTRLARHMGLRGQKAREKAKEIMLDAMSVEPKTNEGSLVRQIAKADAERSTNTDKRVLAERALKFRQLLNVGDLRFGDLNIPFVKTTANAIQSSLQTSGITVPVSTVSRMVKTVMFMRGGQGFKESTAEGFKGFGEEMVRAGLGSTAAFLIANAIDKEDYVGVYPTSDKERELFKAKNAVANSIRINDKYYSLDFLGPLFAPVVGFLNAKKYGTNFPTRAYYYGTGVGYQVLKTPGLDYAAQTLDYLKKTLSSSAKAGASPKDIQKQIANYAVDFFQSRAIPGFAQTLAELGDDVKRDSSKKEDIFAPIKAQIPGVRQTLPKKKTVFGEDIKTEGWMNLVFGGRRKTAVNDPVLTELSRLNSVGQLPSVTNVEENSSRAQELKEQIGKEKFAIALEQYGKALKRQFEIVIKQPRYKNSADEKKKSILDNIKDQQFELMLRRNHYRKPRKQL